MKFIVYTAIILYICSACNINAEKITGKTDNNNQPVVEATTISTTDNPTATTPTPTTPIVPDGNDTTTSPTTTSTAPTTTTTTTIKTTSTTVPTPDTTVSPNTTVSPSPPTTVKPPTPTPEPSRSQWSTTSFIGGMVFSFGMMAIGFVAFKFYKARNERNYHTL